MHVIVLTSSNSASGGARQALYLADGLNKQGHVVHFVSPAGGKTSSLIQEMNLHYVPLPKSIFETERTLRSLMPANEPVILHAFHNKGVKRAAYLGTYWRMLRLPVACIAHRGITSRPGNPSPYLLPGIRAYLVNSRACATTLPLLWRKSRCHVVNNSIPESRLIPLRAGQEVRRELGLPDGCAIIGNICNDNPLKGAGQAIKAFALSRASMPPSKLIVVGVTPQRWQPLCAELDVLDDVRLVPMTDHIADYMQLMDILVFPSMFVESQPNVIIEAMSLGIPVIAGDVGGIRELLPAECLFNPQNEHEISSKLIKLLTSPDLLRSLGEINAKQKYKFSTEHRLKTVLGYYRQALEEMGFAAPL